MADLSQFLSRWGQILFGLFERVLNVSVMTGILIVLILAVRCMLRRYSKVYTYYLWNLSGLCFIYAFIPAVHLPIRQIWLLVSAGGRNAGGEANEAQPGAEMAENILSEQSAGAGSSSISDVGNSAGAASSSIAGEGVGMGSDPTPAAGTADGPGGIVSMIDMGDRISAGLHSLSHHNVLLMIWLAGMIFLLSYTFFSYVRQKRQLRYAVRLYGNIYECDCIAGPFVQGVVRPKIYIPYRLDESDREFIIAHEMCHVRRRDYLILIFFRIVSAVLWFDPLIWISCRLMRLDMEMSCDEVVISDFEKKGGVRGKSEYMNALLHFAQKSKGIRTAAFSAGKSALKVRVMNIMKVKKKNGFIPLIAIVLCLSASVVFVSYAVEGNDKNMAEPAGLPDGGTDCQAVVEERLSDVSSLGNVNAVIMDENGNILAQKGDIDQEVAPGSALRPILAAEILSGGKIGFDSEVSGNRMICTDGNMKSSFQNWLPEADKITFEQALRSYSQIGLASAFLTSKADAGSDTMSSFLKEYGMTALSEDGGFSDDASVVTGALGQNVKISARNLAEAYRSIFADSSKFSAEHSVSQQDVNRLRDLLAEGLQTSCRYSIKQYESSETDSGAGDFSDFNFDLDMAGAMGSAPEYNTDSGEYAHFASSFVGDIDTAGGKLIIALNIINNGEERIPTNSMDVCYKANQILTDIKY